MKLFLKGHGYQYAAEQILLMMFPEERPEYPEQDSGEEPAATLSLSMGAVYATAHTQIRYHGKQAAGSARVLREKLAGELETDRWLQRILKVSFYKAAIQITGKKPAWGALTGIRPGKIATAYLESGCGAGKAARQMQKEYFVSPERSALCIDTARAALKVKRELQPRDVALYIGIPFCPTRCAYCSFVSQSVEKSFHLIKPYLQALFSEIEETGRIVEKLGLRVISVYIGGGTPTTLAAEELAALILKLRASFDFSAVSEFTVEAGRPDTITEEKLKALQKGGVTRISINPQTMADHVLSAIGRRHTAEDIKQAFFMARQYSTALINMDLIAGLPEDTAESFCKTLDEVIALGPENITVHTLSLKKGSFITLEKTAIPGENAVSQMLDYAAKRLREEGYRPYYLYRQKFISGGFENVGWSKKGAESLYNICIMEELCSILSMGGGGSTKLVAPKTGHIERVFNPKYPQEYIDRLERILEGKKQIAKFYLEEVL